LHSGKEAWNTGILAGALWRLPGNHSNPPKQRVGAGAISSVNERAMKAAGLEASKGVRGEGWEVACSHLRQKSVKG